MADLIERSKAISAVNWHGQRCDCIEEIRRIPAVNRWIPCSERMPEVGIPVLIYDKHYKAFFVAKLDEDYFGFSSNMWHYPADVPFWMPLPEPPESEVQEDAERN